MFKRSAPRAFLALAVVLMALVSASPTSAAVPAYSINMLSTPTNLPPGGEGTILVEVFNLGDASAVGGTSPIVITDKLPPDLEATAISGKAGAFGELPCDSDLNALRCEYRGAIAAYDFLLMRINVKVAEDAPTTVFNEVGVSGGGAARVVLREPLKASVAPTEFGVEKVTLVPSNEDGSLDTQAGSHPFELTSRLNVNHAVMENSNFGQLRDGPIALTKDLRFDLPAGLVGNPQVIPQCTSQEFDELLAEDWNGCPPESAVGVAVADISSPGGGFRVPLFNLVPSPGEPAKFGFSILHVPVILDTSIRTGSDYGVVVSVSNISQVYSFFGAQATFWGVPADPRHDSVRGWSCLETEIGNIGEEVPYPCVVPSKPKLTPFLTLPTSCDGPAGSRTTVEADSWPQPGVFKGGEYTLQEPTGGLLGFEGCNHLPFAPSLSVTPDGTAASSSSGLSVGVHVSQEGQLNPTGLAESSVKHITVTLPAGVATNPSGGNGLEGCTESLVGFTGFAQLDPAGEPGVETATFTPKLPGSFGSEEALQPGVNFCADASKIGTVTIKTPLLANPLEGAVYLASQNQNPFGSLVAMYAVAEDPVSGALVKLPFDVALSPVTGQLEATESQVPQLPFEEAEFHFFGGERAPLATPARCGAYTTTASFAPWSGNEPANVSSTFAITSGPHGGPCPGASLPFSPFLTGGSTNINAGAFTPLTTTIGREDGEQNMAQVQLHFPPGLLGSLQNVKLCLEPQADQGTCGPESLIGETTVSAGVGNDPVAVTGGKVYITGSYDGHGNCATGAPGCAPFGLSIVNPVKAGPFDLEHDTSNPSQQPACDCIVVRGKLELDPHTAALTFTSNTEAEGYAIPHMIDGIPVQIKKVNVLINREHFTFNPTNCTAMQITGGIESDEGAVKPVAERFQATNCAVLKFEPKFTVATSGRSSKANGTSLSVKLTYPNTPFGSQANIKQVKVELPKQLPSRLTTLQQACTAAQFNANPAGCPAASVVGHAKAITPLIPVPLEGPAYFVSNGAEAFPNLIMVLQGYGVTIDLVGDTFISKQGITSSTFKTVPDAPVGSFELTLPTGKFSALTANGNLCKSKLTMPTEFIAQNGQEIHRSTPVTVEGCVPAITVVGHRVKGKTATIQVSVPAAGRLVATGKGLSKASKTATGATTLTVKLSLTNGEAAALSKHKGRKLRARINLTFTPKHGNKLKTSTTVIVG